jgi:hypothetical protein
MVCCVKFWNVKALHKILLIARVNEVIARTVYRQTGNICAAFEVLTAVVTKSSGIQRLAIRSTDYMALYPRR